MDCLWKPACLQAVFQLTESNETVSSPSLTYLFNNVFMVPPQGCCVVLEQRTFTISLKTSIGLLGGGDGRGFEHWSTTCKRWVPRFSSMSSSPEPELASRFWLMHLVPFSGVFSLRSRRLGVECNSWLTVFQMHQYIGKWPSILLELKLSAENSRRLFSHQRTGILATASGKEIST